MVTRTALVGFCVWIMAGCAGETGPGDKVDEPSEAPFAFEDPVAGKADGPQAVVPVAQLMQVEARLGEAITAAEAQVAELTRELGKLDRDLPLKQDEVERLVANVEQRRREVSADFDRQRNNALIFAFFGVPAGVFLSLAQALDSDSALQRLNADLARAKSERDSITTRIADYQRRRDGLAARLATLGESKRALVTLLRSARTPRPAPAGILAVDWAEIDRLGFRVDTLGRVLDNTRGQAALLDEMVTLAQGASDALDRALRTLRQLSADADRTAAESRTDALRLLKIVLSGDPTTAARAFLEERLAARARASLTTLGWAAGPFVDVLMGGDPDRVLRDALLARLRTDLLPSAPAVRSLRISGPAGRIADLGAMSSTARSTQSGLLRRAHAKIVIRHSYRNDLVVTLKHGDKVAILAQHEGGAADDLLLDVDVAAFAGTSASGDFVLEVKDTVADDEGRLESFSLELEAQ